MVLALSVFGRRKMGMEIEKPVADDVSQSQCHVADELQTGGRGNYKKNACYFSYCT